MGGLARNGSRRIFFLDFKICTVFYKVKRSSQLLNNPKEIVKNCGFVTFTEGIINGKLEVLCSGLTHMPLLEKSKTDFEGTKRLIH